MHSFKDFVASVFKESFNAALKIDSIVDRLNIILFLGAGASTPFGKPTTAQLRDKLRPPDTETRNSFRNLILTCPQYVDFEYIYYNAVKIRDFINSSAGDFLRYISKKQNALHTTRDPGGNQINFHETMQEWDKVVNSLEDNVFENYRWSSESNEDLQAIYDPLFNYLKNKSTEICVCTTNYDKAIESYCEIKKYCCVDGFQEISGKHRWVNGKFYYPNKINGQTYVYLYKLHGSLDWKVRNDGEIIKTNEEGKPVDPSYKQNLLIYPTLDPKPIESDPLNTIKNEFIKKMKAADVCIVIGFSFRDKHIADLLSQKGLIIIGKRADDAFYNNYRGTKTPTLVSASSTAIELFSYGHEGHPHFILHNVDKANIGEIISTIDNMLSADVITPIDE
jgi:hypothetical protein